MSSTRLTLVVTNLTPNDVTCTDVSCEQYDNLSSGTVIKSSETGTFTSQTNNRIFCTWGDSDGNVYKMAMTCPKSASNSACGITDNAGLRTYEEHGTPVTFTYLLGQANQADWDSGSSNGGHIIQYQECSKTPEP